MVVASVPAEKQIYSHRIDIIRCLRAQCNRVSDNLHMNHFASICFDEIGERVGLAPNYFNLNM